MESEPLFKFFKYDHLPDHLQAISKPFFDLAKAVILIVPEGSERTRSLEFLLSAKDCAVRAAL